MLSNYAKVSSRPLAGLYAAVVTVVGFRFYHPVNWALAVLTAIGFAGITWNIMSFNDWADRYHDQRKGKMFASENPQLLVCYWLTLTGCTVAILISISVLALFENIDSPACRVSSRA